MTGYIDILLEQIKQSSYLAMEINKSDEYQQTINNKQLNSARAQIIIARNKQRGNIDNIGHSVITNALI